MIACIPDHVKVVATVIANSIPEAFAGYETFASEIEFDIDRDFSERERQGFLALAGRIVDALATADLPGLPARALDAFA